MEHEERRRRVWGRTILLSAALLVVLPGLAGGVAVLVEYFTRSWSINPYRKYEEEFRVGVREDGVLEARLVGRYTNGVTNESTWFEPGTSRLEGLKITGDFVASIHGELGADQLAQLDEPIAGPWAIQRSPLPHAHSVFHTWEVLVLESRFDKSHRRVIAATTITPDLNGIASKINETIAVRGHRPINESQVKSVIDGQFDIARRDDCVESTEGAAQRFTDDGLYEVLGVVYEIRVDHKPPMTFRFVRVPALASLGPVFIPIMLLPIRAWRWRWRTRLRRGECPWCRYPRSGYRCSECGTQFRSPIS